MANQDTDNRPPVDADTFRRSLSHFVSGVVVVTGQADDTPVGITCSAFTSVSLDPPLVLFCVNRGSGSWSVIRDAGRFCVNILGADQTDLCTLFASKVPDRFGQVEWQPADCGSPLLGGAISWLSCDIEEVFEGGDHEIVVGRVRDAGVVDDAAPLVYYKGGFGNFEAA